MGTSTQLGQVVGITVIIYEYSTPFDRQVLVQAFDKGQNQGLVNALTKMKAVGRISITGTLGYDLSYIRLIPTPTGRKFGSLPIDSSRSAKCGPTLNPRRSS